ncbi:MAG: hypothetical protein D6761_08820 [Candidatus Dadabacteria bacterium]|nr:MAG: hypothetical protein D6761_08820 [Candidatus Dadabacteria bacterium]
MNGSDRIAAGLSRRTALKLGAAGVLAAGTAAWFARLRPVAYERRLRADETPVALSARHFAIAGALVEVFCPRNGAFPDGRMLGIAQRIDEEVWSMPAQLRRDFTQALDLLEFAPPSVGIWSRLTSLAAARRADVVAAYDRHRLLVIRQATTALRQVAVMFYYNHPAVWSAIDYPGPFVPRSLPASSVAYRNELERRRSAS